MTSTILKNCASGAHRVLTCLSRQSRASNIALAPCSSPCAVLRARNPPAANPLALSKSLAIRAGRQRQVRTRVQYLFRQHQHLTGAEQTQAQLVKGYKWLDAFKKASQGDEKQRTIMARYSRLIAAKVEKEHWKRLVRKEVAWQARLRSRPILTGALLKPSLYNPPLPRMKPQPPAISQMIYTRMRARDRRFARQEQLLTDLDDLKHEAALEEQAIRLAGLRGGSPVYCGDAAFEWQAPLQAAHTDLNRLLNRDIVRSQTPPSPALLETLRAARREKIANKTRERTRERRGEVLPRTLARARKGPPAHLLPHMTRAERHADRIVRGVGEVGYVGMVKRRMGVKLRDGGKGLARENGTDLEGERLQRLREMEKEYWVERRRRMQKNNITPL